MSIVRTDTCKGEDSTGHCRRRSVVQMKLTAVFEPAEEGGYVCWLEEMPCVQSQGETVEEARANLIDALQLSLDYLREKARQESSPRSLREPLEVPAR